ncbi:MAG: alanine racemase [Dehalococcoidia bacterium]
MQQGIYKLSNPTELDTPAMITYPHIVQENIDEIIRICGDPEKIVPHSKTHKSSDVLKMQLEKGIKSFKCATLKEAEMVAGCGGSEVVIAYPMVHPRKLERFSNLVESFPDTTFMAIASTRLHLNLLSEASKRSGADIGVYMDLDTGMRRTGVQPGKEANQFYQSIEKTGGIVPIGLHVFDGETTYIPDFEKRANIVKDNISKMEEIWDEANKNGIEVRDNLAGGSWSFQHYVDHPNIRPTPGTWIYWDSRNSQMNELGFEIASLVLGQVIDEDLEMGTVTIDIGSKSCSSDQPLEHRFKLVQYPDTELVLQNEEHGVVKLNGTSLNVGDFVIAAPGHACTLTVKFPYTNVVSKEGKLIGRFVHDARDR